MIFLLNTHDHWLAVFLLRPVCVAGPADRGDDGENWGQDLAVCRMWQGSHWKVWCDKTHRGDAPAGPPWLHMSSLWRNYQNKKCAAPASKIKTWSSSTLNKNKIKFLICVSLPCFIWHCTFGKSVQRDYYSFKKIISRHCFDKSASTL